MTSLRVIGLLIFAFPVSVKKRLNGAVRRTDEPVETEYSAGSSVVGNLLQLKNASGHLIPLFASIILAALTLGVFSRLQDYGPESAIRRFNQAIVHVDPDDMQKVTLANTHKAELRYLVVNLENWYQQGAYMRVAEMERTSDEVRAAVLYTFPGSQTYPKGTQRAMIWVVVRKGKAWFVDANKTATILHDSQGD